MFSKRKNEFAEARKFEQPRPRAQEGWIVLTDSDSYYAGVSPLRSVRKSAIDSVRQRRTYTTVTYAGGFIHCKEEAAWIMEKLRDS